MTFDSTHGSRMNRRRVIILMTLGVFIVLGTLMILFFEGLPPWPVALWFTASHVFFCIVIARVKPFPGPHREPMAEPELPRWTP